jgi:hypothetical protein
MICSTLVMIVVLGQSPENDPQALISRLGAAHYAERETAASELERLGRKALPALRLARELKDLEVRTRAVSLINKIEGALLTQPTMISLDFDNRPLPEVVKTVSDQAGLSLMLIPDNAPQWAARRVTLHEPAPLPFWKALDRLCDAARLQYNYGMYGLPQGRQAALPLFDGGGRPTIPTVDTGPFRVSVMGLHFQRDVTFPVAGPRLGQPFPPQGVEQPGSVGQRFNPAVSENCYAQIQVIGEPRLSVSQSGLLKIIEAVDDKGQSLINTAARAAITQRSAGYFGINAGSAVQLQATLTRPEQPGQMIRKLRGVVPLSLATRKPNPLAVKLDGATGKTFRNDDVAVTIADIRPLGNTRQTTIEMSIRSLTGASGGPSPGQPDFVVQRPDSFQQTIEVTDGQGRPMPWYQTSFDMEAARVTLTVTPQTLDGNGTPAELRLYGLARATTEVEFEFHDLRMP